MKSCWSQIRERRPVRPVPAQQTDEAPEKSSKGSMIQGERPWRHTPSPSTPVIQIWHTTSYYLVFIGRSPKKKKKKITLGRAAENSWNPDRTQTLVLKYYQWISMQSVLSNNNFVHSIYTSIHVYVCVYTHKYPCKLSNVIR